MQVALLSLTDAVVGDLHGLRGVLTIGGRSLARHQLGLALGLGCTRIVVVSEGLTGEVMALQAAAEAGGARFHVIASAHALLPLITADDELIVLSDGLLAMPDIALANLAQGTAVLALPVEQGVAAGFERIDINHAFAGAMRLPGRLVAGLSELPQEWHAQSALLRLAVQNRLPLRVLPASLIDQGRWSLVLNEDEAHRIEPVWLRLHTASAHVRSPGEWIAARTVHWVGPALLHAGTRPLIVALGAVVALLLALGLGWLGWRTPGFALLGLCWVLARMGMLITQIEQRSLLETSRPAATGFWFEIAIDAALVVLAAWRSEMPALPGMPWAIGWFAPLILLLLLHYLPRVMPDVRGTWWLRDRFVVAIGFCGCSLLLPFDLAVRAAVLGLIVWAMVTTPVRAPAIHPDLTSND